MHRILIVDDSPVAALQLEHCLAKSGHTNMAVVDDARKALQILADTCPSPDVSPGGDTPRPPQDCRQFDLVLMDINMPELDGIAATRLMKEHPHLQDIPVILISASDEKDVLEDGFNAGAIDFITKPINLMELRARVKAALRLKEETDRRKARERELEALKDKFELLSNLDGLTGIANRRRFDKAFDAEWLRARREQRPISLLMIDIDHFKKYNDTYGHLQGDVCLRAVAKAVAGSMHRPADLAARFGGEEFVALLPNTDLPGARAIAQQVQQLVEELELEHKSSEVSPLVTVSVGGACALPGQDMDSDALIHAADTALYAAKHAGRNRIVMHGEHAAEGCLRPQ
ncbi:MAG: diguanylate cyclase [Desulfovibrio sp.]|nr:diguanylate cyclase [Desulfovibrio sp.]